MCGCLTRSLAEFYNTQIDEMPLNVAYVDISSRLIRAFADCFMQRFDLDDLYPTLRPHITPIARTTNSLRIQRITISLSPLPHNLHLVLTPRCISATTGSNHAVLFSSFWPLFLRPFCLLSYLCASDCPLAKSVVQYVL